MWCELRKKKSVQQNKGHSYKFIHLVTQNMTEVICGSILSVNGAWTLGDSQGIKINFILTFTMNKWYRIMTIYKNQNYKILN